MDDSTNSLPIGTIVGGSFEITALLGRGASAIVYRAKHQITEKDVALKLLDKNAFGSIDVKRKSRFENEAKNASRLDHPNIVKLLSFGFHEEAPFLVMELINGLTLEQHLASNGRLSILQFRIIFADLLSGLEYLHQANIVHRDIKPGNILLEHGIDDSVVPKLSDFGLAKALQDERSQNLTATNEIPGTPAYMSPEQCQKGELSQRSDIYALGCVMYEALTLTPPFQATNALDLMYKHAHESPPSLNDHNAIPKDLAELIAKCLRKAEGDRWSSAAELREAVLYIKPLKKRFPVIMRVALLFLLALVPLSALFYLKIVNVSGQHKTDSGSARKQEQDSNYSAMSPAKAIQLSTDTFSKKHDTFKSEKILDSLEPRLKDPRFQSADRREYYIRRYLLEVELRDAESALAAAKNLEREIKASPQYGIKKTDLIPALVWQCHSWARLRRFKEALTALTQARNILGPDDRKHWEMIEQAACDTHFLQGDFQDSLKEAKAILAPHPATDFEDKAINILKKSLAERFALLRIYAIQHDQKSFSQTYEQCKTIFQQTPELKKQLNEIYPYALILIDHGDLKEAKTVLLSVRDLLPPEKQELWPLCGRIWQALGKVELLEGNFAEAKTNYERSIELCSHSHACETATALLARAYISSKTGRTDRAASCLTQALKLPLAHWLALDTGLQNVDLYISCAQLYNSRNEIDGTKRCYECALTLPQITPEQRNYCEGQLKILNCIRN